MKRYHIGVDIGQIHDHTAIAVVSRDTDKDRDGIGLNQADPFTFELYCDYIQTLQLGIKFQDIAQRIGEIEGKLKDQGEVVILVDATGCGQPIPELIQREVESEVVACRFTGGAEAVYERRDYWKIPKGDMINNLKIVLGSGRLDIAAQKLNGDQERAIEEMMLELQNFQYEQPKEGARGEIYEGKFGTHDDLVTALGLACWGAKEWQPPAKMEILF